MMAMDNSWSAAEKASVRPQVTRLQRWKEKRLAFGLALTISLILLISLLLGAFIYYNSVDPPVEKLMALKNPCDTMFCPFGARCLLDERTQQPFCQCESACPDLFSLVCGDDGITYSNECRLMLASCIQQRKIVLLRRGPCDIQDPCVARGCQFGSRCVKSEDGRFAECVCDDKCEEAYQKLGPRPVCGSDGRNYQNACQLKKASCKESRAINIKYKGVCDPCDGVECQTFQVCQLDDSRNAICRCNSICSPDFKPICGSDGKTYINECTLRVEACKSRRNIRIIFTGECSTGSNACDNLQCGPSQYCDIDRNGSATCHCVESCELVMRPVCGSDGDTYDNECEMRKQACLQKRTLYVAYRGQCGDRGPCFSYHCASGAICVVKGGLPMCECPSCAEEYDPVCGTDEIPYINECKLKREACEQKLEIAVAYNGLCNGCEDKRCDYYAVCKTDGKGKGTCVCPQNCYKADSIVCGSDEVTYDNECEMKVAACKKAQYVMVVSKGPCDLCQHVKCKYGARCEEGRCICPTNCPKEFDPVCANDGITYSNECEMRKAACKNNQDLNMLFYGECDEVVGSGHDMGSGMESDCHSKSCKYGGECGYDDEGLPVCYCSFKCPGSLEPVCASDGKLYENECKIKEEACHTQKRLMPVHIEMCEEFREVPCDGEFPLIDQATGKEYFCGDGIGSKLCPPGSYCHKSSAFAKCCSEVILVKTCAESIFGCCLDGKTQAQGPRYAGCPSVCNCNRLGSFGLTCDPESKQCTCKPGVGGPRCDRCEPGYWGLHKNSEESSGCSPCACNLRGSVRDDCEQMTGRCVCKHGIQGIKCDICPKGTVLGPDGCVDASIALPIYGSCSDIECYHGAVCQEKKDQAQCVCEMLCDPDDNSDLVCGTDGNTYGSECQMKHFSCQYQKTIHVMAYAPCNKVQKVRRSHKNIQPFIEHSIKTLTYATRKDQKMDTWEQGLANEVNASVPHFTQRLNNCLTFCSYNFLESSKIVANSRLSIEINITIFTSNGIIFYGEDERSNGSKFISLAVRNGFLELRLNFGNGKRKLKLEQPFLFGSNCLILVNVEPFLCVLKADSHSVVTPLEENEHVNISGSFFFGSVPSMRRRITRNVRVHEGILGCLYNVSISIPRHNITFTHYEWNYTQTPSIITYPLFHLQNKQDVKRRLESEKCSIVGDTDLLEKCLPQCNYRLEPMVIKELDLRRNKQAVRAGDCELRSLTLTLRTESSHGQLLHLRERNGESCRSWKLLLNSGRLEVAILQQRIIQALALNRAHVSDGRLHKVKISWFDGFIEVFVDGLTHRTYISKSHFPNGQKRKMLGSCTNKKHDIRVTWPRIKASIHIISVNGVPVKPNNSKFES